MKTTPEHVEEMTYTEAWYLCKANDCEISSTRIIQNTLFNQPPITGAKK